MIHNEPHPKAGEIVTLVHAHDPQRHMVESGVPFRVEDWYDRISEGQSWRKHKTFATHWYQQRAASTDLPLDDEVLYGHIGSLGHLVHISEIPKS